ncbi:hypothetical protein D030_1786B, partial [Vibrio parahaemolyticus AQ3810]
AIRNTLWLLQWYSRQCNQTLQQTAKFE